jgi:hypothetical protein
MPPFIGIECPVARASALEMARASASSIGLSPAPTAAASNAYFKAIQNKMYCFKKVAITANIHLGK